MRRSVERRWGCENRELVVSELSQSESFRRFAKSIIEEADHFRDVYNTAIRDYRLQHRLRSRNHPAAELEPGELPFWTVRNEHRHRTWQRDVNLEELRPKALILTLFVRLILGDFFLHGLGGGKYDEVTDSIIRQFFNIEPPAFQILTATLHLPFPELPNARQDFERFRQYLRHQYWNPHYHLLVRNGEAEMANHRAIIEMPVSTRQQRLERFAAFRKFSQRLRPVIQDRIECIQWAVNQFAKKAEAHAILTRRDYAWILYPESELKPFLQRFLT